MVLYSLYSRYLRSAVLEDACMLDHPECKEKVLEMFSDWMTNGVKYVYCCFHHESCIKYVQYKLFNTNMLNVL